VDTTRRFAATPNFGRDRSKEDMAAALALISLHGAPFNGTTP
jgi:hypothetical protein